MSLQFLNGYMGSSVYVCILYSDSNKCAKMGEWTKEGWWEISPGQTITAWSGGTLGLGDVAGWNRYWYYYAYSTDGQEVWNGPITEQVPDIAFQQCLNDNSNCAQTVGFAQIDVGGNWTYTVALVPQGYVPNQGSSSSSGWTTGSDDGNDDPNDGASGDAGWSDSDGSDGGDGGDGDS